MIFRTEDRTWLGGVGVRATGVGEEASLELDDCEEDAAPSCRCSDGSQSSPGGADDELAWMADGQFRQL